MKVSVEDISSVEKVLTVTIEKELVASEYEKGLSQAVKKAVIKGFRKGKAPRSFVENLYSAKINEDVISKLIGNSYKEVLTENGLEPIIQPQMELKSFNKEEDFVYLIRVELMPEFDVADYSGFDLLKKRTDVRDDDVENTIQSLIERQAIFKETDAGREIKDSDMVLFDYKGHLSDGKLIKDGHKENFTVLIGANNLISGFEDNLIGLKTGDEKEFVVTFPDDYFEKEYAGKGVKFHVIIKEIKERELPELNDNFAKDMGCDNVNGLKLFLKGQLTKEKESMSKMNLREQIVDKLLELNQFDVPGSLIENQIDYIIKETKKKYGTGEKGKPNFDMIEADMRENSREMAIKIIKRDLILGAIVKKESISADDAEIEDKYKELAENMKRSVKEIRDYYKKLNAEKYLKEEIIIQKAYDSILEKANVKEGT